MKKIAIFGSTGSIGRQTLDVIRANGKQAYSVYALTASGNAALLERQAREFLPAVVCVADEKQYGDLKIRLADTNIRVTAGKDALCDIARGDYDLMISAIVGIAGLPPTAAAIETRHDIALANKETLVAGGEWIMALARDHRVKIIPVDSEHSAIFQCLDGHNKIAKIILTASGGPFYGFTKGELASVTVEQALRHPNWSMGAKITIDSATLMNKGLELIEAMRLFSVSCSEIEVLIHRQSIVHSAVEYADGAVIAQLGIPDMRLPIQYALTCPERLPCPQEKMNLIGKNLTFAQPDEDTFLCLKAAKQAANADNAATVVLNGANEAAVNAFLNGKITFLRIGELVTDAVAELTFPKPKNLRDILTAHQAAYAYITDKVQ
jgi:1-deoxy-D-xylulose-5-phosphate reductoisomerase